MGDASDRLAVTELLYRYAELVDAGEFDKVGALLARATFVGTGTQPASGAAAIAQFLTTTIRRYPDAGNTPRTRHLVLNPLVEIGGSRASARSTFCVVQLTETVPLQPIAVGRYQDAFARDEAGWYFTARQADLEMVGDVSGHLMSNSGGLDK
jgi:hypothetical protein